MMALVEPPIQTSSLVEADLSVSWNTGSAKRYWYRVEGKCAPADCENLGVGFNGCNNVLLLTTVSATSVPELCDVLMNPRTNAPLMTEVVSIRRYSRPVFKADIQDGQCNVLDPVEFCHIPECFDFCPQPKSLRVLPRPSAIRPRRFPSGGVSSLSDYDFGSETVTFTILNELGEEILAESGEELLGEMLVPAPVPPGLFISGSAKVSCTFFDHDSFGVIKIGGFAYFVSPRGTFRGSGSVRVSGRGVLVKKFTASGGVSISGSATFARHFSMSGGIEISGASINESLYYSHEMSGGVIVSGAVSTNFSNLGTIEVPAAMAATVFGMGLELLEPTAVSELTISSFSVSACGCSAIGPTIAMRHNLSRSLVFDQFLKSGGLSYPPSLPLRYRASDRIWSSVECLRGRLENWTVSASMQCQTDTWRFSLGAQSGNKQTRLVLDIPADVVCGEGYVTTSILAYFNSYSPGGSGVRINVVTPDKSRYLSVSGEVEAFVDGIFVPQTVYYDELGLFKDSYWYSAPLEIDLDPASRNKSTIMDISWVR